MAGIPRSPSGPAHSRGRGRRSRPWRSVGRIGVSRPGLASERGTGPRRRAVNAIVDQRKTVAAPAPAPGRDRAATLAGALLAATGVGIVLSTITNEALYPAIRHYSTFADTISSLSGTEPPDSYTVEPNRLIFIVTMAVAGVLVLAAAALLRHLACRRLLIALTVFGAGLVGIAVFPGDVATWHPLFALACFVGGSIAAILSRTLLERPLRGFAVALGSVALAATVLGLEFFADFGP